MRHKSAAELALLRDASAILDAAVATLGEAARAGRGVTDCILAAEHTALQRGAQDVRSLFSRDRGRTLRPFDTPVVQPCDPLQAYLAVRYDGYWADAFVRVGTRDNALAGQAAKMLEGLITGAKPGMSARALYQLAEADRRTHALHPLADPVFGSSIGLSLDEPPLLTRDGDTVLEAGAVYSLRSGLIDEAGNGAVVSAMVLMTEQGPQVLLPAGGLS
jgi:Xaa-Pro aminopeptidase/Xaa-Pro dipeptidase